MNLTFTKNLPTVAPKSLTVFNQSYTGEEKIIYRATREELKNLVESGLAVHVSKRKRKPISKSSLPPFPGSHPSPWSLGPGRNNEGGKTHTTNPLSPYPRPPPHMGVPLIWCHLVIYFPTWGVEDRSILPKTSGCQSSTKPFSAHFPSGRFPPLQI